MINENRSPRSTAILKCMGLWVAFMGLLLLSGGFIVPFFPASWERLVYGIFGTISAFVATWLVLKSEQKTFADYGLIWQPDTAGNFLKGLAIGFVLFAGIIAILLVFTPLEVKQNNASWNLLGVIGYVALIPLAFMEELAFRAVPFLKLNKAFGLRITQIILALAFALYHIAQGWNVPTAFFGPAIWALIFAWAAAWSGGIALPTGIHVALNAAQQLTGLKGGELASFWKLQEPVNASVVTLTHIETVGMVTQLLVLAGGLVLTELYHRKKRLNQ